MVKTRGQHWHTVNSNGEFVRCEAVNKCLVKRMTSSTMDVLQPHLDRLFP